ncbi:hypothetical protein EVAR_27287_1 [Eumeta japonica]|uniref:Uncharacterized protein n=1 Tax=Eumeta variegata TaxID=151549 RepID=A0A4C1UDR2_EUMVA|nr:hypothetical protein EVAR_27287_1 [Eumeta japonica]
MVALQRAIRRVKNRKYGLDNIFSDFRSSLKILTSPKTYHPLAHEARHDLFEIVAEGKTVRPFQVIRAATSKSSKNDTPREAQVRSTIAAFPGWNKHTWFKLWDSPYCACNPAKIQEMLHVLEECDMFLRERAALEMGIDIRIARLYFPEIMKNPIKRENLLKLCGVVVEKCRKLYRS